MISKVETIISSQKFYFIETISERAFGASERKQLSKKTFAFNFEKVINKLMLSSIEKLIIFAKNNASNFNNFSNFLIDIFNQSTSTLLLNIMFDVNNFNNINVIQQQ